MPNSIQAGRSALLTWSGAGLDSRSEAPDQVLTGGLEAVDTLEERGWMVETSDGLDVLVTDHAQRRFRERTGLGLEELETIIRCGTPTFKKPGWVRPRSMKSRLKAFAWLNGTVWSARGRLLTEIKVVLILTMQGETFIAMTVVVRETGLKRVRELKRTSARPKAQIKVDPEDEITVPPRRWFWQRLKARLVRGGKEPK